MNELVGEVRLPSGTLIVIDPCNLEGHDGPAAAVAVEQRVPGLPRDRALAIEGERVADDPDFWSYVAVRVSDAPIATSVHVGDVPVDTARLLFADSDIAKHWIADESLDGLADVAFWGRDEELLARATGATRLADGVFGWADLDVSAAEERLAAARALQAEHGWMLMTDHRPHTHDWALLARATTSPTASGTIDIGERRVCLALVNQGDGSYGVHVDRAADGSLVRVRVDLHWED